MGRLAIVLALALLWLPTSATAQQVINLRNADIRAFIEDVSRVTGRVFVIDPAVQGKVSVVAERPLTRTQYFEVFLSTLRANGLVAIPTKDRGYRIVPAANAARQPSRGSSGGFVTQVLTLKTIDTESALQALRPLVSKEGQMTASRSGRALVVADYADNLARVRAVLKDIDRDRSTMRLITLSNAGARDIAASIEAASRAGGGASQAVSVIAVDSSNSVILRGEPGAVANMAGIVAQLDARAAVGADVQVIFLEHADAAGLLPVLQQIAGQQVHVAVAAESGGGEPGDGALPTVNANVAPGRASIALYKEANALIVSAPPDVQRTLGEVIRKLDTRQEQVLVEAIIVEISDVAAKQLGVQFLLSGTRGSNIPFGVTNFSNAAPNLIAAGGALAARRLDRQQTMTSNGVVTTTKSTSSATKTLQDAAVQSALGVTGSLFGFGGKIGNDALFGAVINAVKSDTASNILSTPSIMTLDNREARMLVGQEIPITTGEALSNNFNNQFRTVQRQNVGIQLDVRPQVNRGGTIKLFLRQEVSSVAGPVATGSSDLILNKREFETTVTVDDGEIIAIGGLLDDNERRTLQKVPLLGDIPLVGELFKSRSRNRTKTNLMVFIRPRVIGSRDEARAVAAQRYNYVRADQRARNPEREPTLDELVRDYLGTVPPVQPTTSTTGENDERGN